MTWVPQGASTSEVEVYVFPGDASFVKVQGTNGGTPYPLLTPSRKDLLPQIPELRRQTLLLDPGA